MPPPPGMMPSPTSGSPISAPSTADPQVAGERHLQPAAQRGAVHRGHEGLRRRLDPPEGVAQRAVEMVHLVRRHAGPLLQVGAGAEGLVPRAGDHHAAHGPVVADAGQVLEQLADHGAGQRVAARLAVDGPDLDAVLPLDHPLATAHASPPRRAPGAGGELRLQGLAGQLAPHQLLGQLAGRHQLREVDAGLVPHSLEHVDQVLGGQVARGARRVGAAAQPAHRGVEGGDARRRGRRARWRARCPRVSCMCSAMEPGRARRRQQADDLAGLVGGAHADGVAERDLPAAQREQPLGDLGDPARVHPPLVRTAPGRGDVAADAQARRRAPGRSPRRRPGRSPRWSC